MTVLQLSLGEVEDLMNLFKKNHIEAYNADNVIKIFFSGISLTKGEEKAQKMFSLINRSGNFSFYLDTGRVTSHKDGVEIEVITRKK